MMARGYLPGVPPAVRMNPTNALPLPAASATRPTADAALMGAFFVLAAVSCFAGLDATSKVISAMPVMMLVWFRYMTQAGVTALTQLPRQGRALLRTRHPGLHVLRGVLIMSTSVCSFLSLRYMPVGELTAIIMLTPLLMTLIWRCRSPSASRAPAGSSSAPRSRARCWWCVPAPGCCRRRC